MCRGRNPLNNKSLQALTSAFPAGRRFFIARVPGVPTQQIRRHTSMSTATLDHPTLAIRKTENRDHHLWNNNGTYWVHYTEHLPDYTKRRVRRSLHTDSLNIARVLRDSLLSDLVHWED
jgi:hypothetical protein